MLFSFILPVKYNLKLLYPFLCIESREFRLRYFGYFTVVVNKVQKTVTLFINKLKSVNSGFNCCIVNL